MTRLGAFILIAFLAVGCGGGASSPPTAPGPVNGGGLSAVATNYLDEVIGLMQNNSINRARINWTDFRTQVFQRVPGAQTITDTFPGISVALGLLDDHHSFYVGSANVSVGNPSGRRCSAVSTSMPTMPADVGYVKITGFSSGDAGAVTAFADSIQEQIRRADRASLVGWVVDLRANTGGNMWPMVAGVGPVLGNGVAGFFIPPQGNATPWSFQNGAASSGAAVIVRTSAVYELLVRDPKVAVLTDNLTASSGEAVVVSFRKRANTRSFGAATCGLSTANSTLRLSDGAMLYLTTAVMADRAQSPYGDVIAPDEAIGGDAPVVDRAIAWLRGI
jgi:carboxyl-terminal processing protease